MRFNRLTRQWRGLAAAAMVLALARLAIGVDRGLSAEYFNSLDQRAMPTFRAVDHEISRARLVRSWLRNPPEAFRVRWSGFLAIPADGTYAFLLRSDDGSTMRVDERLLIDNSGKHPAETRTASTPLSAGPHAIGLEFVNEVGGFELEWQWSRDGQRWEAVPGWLLSQEPVSYRRSVAARGLDLALAAVGLLALMLAAPTIVMRGSAAARRYPQSASLLFFAAMTVAQTWPLAAHLASASRNDSGDTLLNEWIMAWVGHQAASDPLHLYDANIFHPNRHTLAYSESLMLQSAIAAPLLWLGASPVLTYNIVLLIGFTLTGWTMALVIRWWTGDWTAALTAGLLLAFNAHVFVRLPHMQAQHAEFLPLAVFALDRLLAEPGIRQSFKLALVLAVQSLASLYLMVFSAVSVAVATLVRPDAWWGRRGVRVAATLALTAVVASVLLIPYLAPYWLVRQEQGTVTRVVAETRTGAQWIHYLGTPSRIDFALFSQRYFVGLGLFPGALGLALTAVALASGVLRRHPQARMCLAIGLAGLALSFGNNLPGFAMLRQLVPLLQVVRDVTRFGYLVIFAVAALAGFGVASLRARVNARRWPALAAALLALVAIEQHVAPIGFTRFGGVPSIYGLVRDVPNAVVAELPIYSRIATHHNAPYLLNSTAHWKPMINGYSGFEPLGYREMVDVVADFPGSRAIAQLQRLGVTHVFVHLESYPDAVVAAVDAMPQLQLIARKEGIALYRLH